MEWKKLTEHKPDFDKWYLIGRKGQLFMPEKYWYGRLYTIQKNRDGSVKYVFEVVTSVFHKHFFKDDKVYTATHFLEMDGIGQIQ